MKFLLVLILGVFLTGCVSTPPPTQSLQPKIVAERIMEAIEDDDVELFMQQINLLSGQQFTKQDFLRSQSEMQKNFGEIIESYFLIELKTPVVNNFVWLLTFERVNNKGDRIIQDMLFRIVIGPLDGQNRVVSMGFI